MYYHHSHFVLSVTGDLPDFQAPPQPCSIKNKTDSDNKELDNNNSNSFPKTRKYCVDVEQGRVSSHEERDPL